MKTNDLNKMNEKKIIRKQAKITYLFLILLLYPLSKWIENDHRNGLFFNFVLKQIQQVAFHP